MTTLTAPTPARSKLPAKRPEILAPAGDEVMMRAAVENGADAVYFGLQQLNARMRAKNFAVEELPETMAGLHERGVKGYVTLNTLIFPGEVEEAAQMLRACSRAGVDAVLVQDAGVAWLAHRVAPELPLHASTQMTISSAEGIAGLESLGLRFERVVLARELSLRELSKMAPKAAVEIEVFVHGALCVAYSGQCLTSEALGGRSANRGECAQACRMPYDLIVDGAPMEVGDLRYVLSPKDLAAVEDVRELAGLGISCLKIEGRYKSPQYVAATVAAYRRLVDETMDGRCGKLTSTEEESLAMTFSRGFTGGYLHAIDHQAVVDGAFGKKRGLLLGEVESVTPRGVRVRLRARLGLGDGVVFEDAANTDDEEGGRIWRLTVGNQPTGEANGSEDKPQLVTLDFGRKTLRTERIKPGQRIWKTSDPHLDSRLLASFAGDTPIFKRPVMMRLTGGPGEAVVLEVDDLIGNCVEVADEAPAQPARNRPLDAVVAQEQLGRLGDTPYEVVDFDFAVQGEVMVPFSRLNKLRRHAISELSAARRAVNTSRREDSTPIPQIREQATAQAARGWRGSAPTKPELAVLCRSLEQVEAALGSQCVTTLYVDFEDPKNYARAREIVPRTESVRFVPATMRVFKPGEAGFVRTLLRAEPDAVLVRTLAAREILRSEAPELPLIGDFSLNVANDLTAALLIEAGFERLTPSYDLNFVQLEDLLRASPPEWFEATIHQYMPMFHMEHCVFCRYLSTGTDYTNCGRPCDTHSLKLRDRAGYEHPVKPDAGCRNTVFNAVAQSGSAYLAQMLDLGLKRYRIEFLLEDKQQATEAITAYADALAGKRDGRGLWRELRAMAKLGVTRGPLDM